ncbi:WbqC family protein [Achromobacter anxifer]|uniref:WbqC family protein n=1 Tax=Achromobacter anxifer TaxID=1287737 RepID=UPI0021589BE0|nr:WbqC family protein [Achromobacter anxifer]
MKSAQKRVAIVQSNYIPWKGYFDMMGSVDTFIFLDDVQSTRRDWRTRNRIKTANGEAWLTIPVHHDRDLRICEVAVADRKWAAKHWRTLELAYARAPFMNELRPWLADLYERAGNQENLSAINQMFIGEICAFLGIGTELKASHEVLSFEALDRFDPTTRLAELCRAVGGTHYLSGPAAQAYLDESIFNERGIGVEWMSYAGYPEYPQLHGEFRHDVTVLDMLLMTGRDAARFIARDAAAGKEIA